MMNPTDTAEILTEAGANLTPSQVLETFSTLHPETSPSLRSQIFQTSNLWNLGSVHSNLPTSDSLSKWRNSKHTPSRIMADCLNSQAFPLQLSSKKKKAKKAKKKKIIKKKKTVQQQPVQQPWSVRQPRGDLMKGLDGLTEVDAMKEWKESLGPQSLRLGKAKAAIKLYQKCVTEQDEIQQSILKDFELERYEHSHTQQKLISQELLFADLLKRCAIMEAKSRNGKTDNIDEQVQTRLHEAAISSTTLEGVMKSAREVSNSYLDDVQRCIDLGQQRYEDLEKELNSTNRELQNAVAKINQLRIKLERMTNEGQRLGERNEDLRGNESNLLKRSMAAERISASEKRRRIHAEDILAKQSAEVARFVHSMIDSCKKHFGFVPPNISTVGVFFAPNVVQIPFNPKNSKTKSKDGSELLALK
jgi:hypothetical protein